MNNLIQLNENMIIIKNGDRIIRVEIDRFNSVRTENGYDSCCDLILQLSQENNLISIKLLYELARILNENLPNHTINWLNTFCVINMGIFNNILNGNSIDGNVEEDEINVFDNIEDAIDEYREVNEELLDDEFRISFEEGVRSKLIEKEIITE